MEFVLTIPSAPPTINRCAYHAELSTTYFLRIRVYYAPRDAQSVSINPHVLAVLLDTFSLIQLHAYAHNLHHPPAF